MSKPLVIFLSIFLAIASFAQENYLNIDADKFEAKEKQNKLYFEGNVRLTKSKDLLTAKKLVINTKASKKNSKKQVPKDYIATGNVKFTVHTKENNILKGSGDKVYYYPSEQKYIIVGNGYLEDVKADKKIRASKIYIDEKTGYTKIDGDKDKPAKFSIKLEEEKK